MATVDFSPLGDLYNIYRQGQQQRQTADWLQGQGLPQNLSLANLALAQQRDTRDFGFREQEAKRAQGNADRSFELQKRTTDATLEGNKVPAGFRPTPTGGLAPIPEGPADPDYIRRVNEAKDKGKQFNANELTKLVEEGGKFSNLTNFSTTFQDRYAGYKIPMAGNAAMAVGRYAPALASQDVAEGAQWWQGYDRYKNVVRNEMFGSALTVNEQAAFERADISPGMDPTQIRANLETQTKILKDGMRRKAGALIAGGYQPEPIARAYGLKLEELGVDTTKRGAAPQASTWKNKETITAARSNPQAAIAEAQQAIQRGADPKAVAQRLQQIGIDPTALTGNTGFAGPLARQ